MAENEQTAVSGGKTPEGFWRCVLGGFGSGKSFLLCQRFWEDYQDGYRFFVTNAPLHLDKCREAMPDAEFVVATNEQLQTWWEHWPRQAVYGIDEAHLIFKSRKWLQILNSKSNVEEYLSQVRKTGDRVYMVTQRFGDLPTFMRDRFQHVTRCYRLPGPFKVFLRWEWAYSDGKPVKTLQFFPKIVPFAAVKQFGELYDTRAMVGKQAQRDAAKFELPKRGGFPKPLLYALVGGLMAGVGWVNRPPKQPAGVPSPSVAAVPSSRPGGSVGRFGGGVLSGKTLSFVDGHYESSMGQVLSVKDDVVVVGSSDGKRVLEFPRDFRAEYYAVRSQVKSSGGSLSGISSGDTQRTGDRVGDSGGPGNYGVLPGLPVRR